MPVYTKHIHKTIKHSIKPFSNMLYNISSEKDVQLKCKVSCYK